MFIDRAKLKLKAGRGGDGAISWRREKFVPAGGPDGGDGGRGGSIYFIADPNIRTLLDYKYQGSYKAESGEPGRGKKMFGKAGEDLYLKVPIGTIIREAKTGLALCDMVEKGQTFLIVKGGRGGKGNVHFKTSTRQAPRFAIPGGLGQELSVILELKLIADVGLVGLPNVGKSTILSIYSNAKPKIANYHFTTLEPNLGVVDCGEGRSFTIADIPGLIEGAGQGAGLGDEFLKHIERTRLLVHVVDISGSEGRDPWQDFLTIQKELGVYNKDLPKKLAMIAANKTDIAQGSDNIDNFMKNLKGSEYKDIPVYEISAATTYGMEDMKYKILEKLKDLPISYESLDEEIVDLEQFFKKDDSITVTRKGNVIIANGDPLKELTRRLIITDGDSVSNFERRLEEMGVMDRILSFEPDEDDTIDIEGFNFDWL